MEHNPYTQPLPPQQFPGALPRNVVEGALPLEYPDPYEAGLLVAVCPGAPTDGRPYKAHRLRVKLIGPNTVDVFCPHGCCPQMLAAAITQIYTDKLRQAAALIDEAA